MTTRFQTRLKTAIEVITMPSPLVWFFDWLNQSSYRRVLRIWIAFLFRGKVSKNQRDKKMQYTSHTNVIYRNVFSRGRRGSQLNNRLKLFLLISLVIAVGIAKEQQFHASIFIQSQAMRHNSYVPTQIAQELTYLISLIFNLLLSDLAGFLKF